MKLNIPTVRKGLMLVDLMAAAAIMTIVILAVGVIVVDSIRGWNNMYNDTYSDIVIDSYVARKIFDSTIRKASEENLLLGENGNWVEVYCYKDADSSSIDRYVRFYYQSDDKRLCAEHGKLNPKETLYTQTVCENVSGCVFKSAGSSIQMILTLNNGTDTITAVSSAVLNNS